MTRGPAPRRVFGAVVAALGVLAAACAEKTLAPAVALSPRFTIQVTTTARRTVEAQKLLILAMYFTAPVVGQRPADSVKGLDEAFVDVTGGPQQVNLKVDITSCLADPTRRGSRDAAWRNWNCWARSSRRWPMTSTPLPSSACCIR